MDIEKPPLNKLLRSKACDWSCKFSKQYPKEYFPYRFNDLASDLYKILTGIDIASQIYNSNNTPLISKVCSEEAFQCPWHHLMKNISK